MPLEYPNLGHFLFIENLFFSFLIVPERVSVSREPRSERVEFATATRRLVQQRDR